MTNQRTNQATNQMGTSTLDAYRGKDHLLLIFAPEEGDATYQRQRQLLHEHETEAEERGLLIFHLFADGESDIAGTQSASPVPLELRDQFDIAEDEFVVLLIGKDGAVKLRKEQPVALQEIFAQLDDRPRRQSEMAHEQGRGEKPFRTAEISLTPSRKGDIVTIPCCRRENGQPC